MANFLRYGFVLLLGTAALTLTGCSLTNPLAPSRPAPKQINLNKTPTVHPGEGMSELKGELSAAETALEEKDWTKAKTHADAAERVFTGIKNLPHDNTQTRVSSGEHNWSSTDIRSFESNMQRLQSAIKTRNQADAVQVMDNLMKLADKYVARRIDPNTNLPVGMNKPKVKS
ncbi:MAG TPA: hypothetical protein VFK80_01780 [Limnochordia bacterium]|nr:hypothetical protein [Limnochordia bacterium]